MRTELQHGIQCAWATHPSPSTRTHKEPLPTEARAQALRSRSHDCTVRSGHLTLTDTMKRTRERKTITMLIDHQHTTTSPQQQTNDTTRVTPARSTDSRHRHPTGRPKTSLTATPSHSDTQGTVDGSEPWIYFIRRATRSADHLTNLHLNPGWSNSDGISGGRPKPWHVNPRTLQLSPRTQP